MDFKGATPSRRFWTPSVLYWFRMCELFCFHPADRPAVQALAGKVGIDSMTVLKLSKNVLEKCPKTPYVGRVARAWKCTLQMSKTPDVRRVTQDFVLALITTIWLCFKMISWHLTMVSKSIQKMFQSRQAGYVSPTSRVKDWRAKKLGVSPRTLVDRPRSGITCFSFKKHVWILEFERARHLGQNF